MEIVNIVAVVEMENSFDLDVLLEKLDNTELNSSKRWLKMRLMPENYYIAFYKSGKFLMTGLKSFKELDNVMERVLNILDKANIKNTIKKLKISNVVLTDSINLKSSIETIAISLNDHKISYEPEQFPGLFYKDKNGISYTLFSSGKIIITGSNDIKIAENNLKLFKKLIRSNF